MKGNFKHREPNFLYIKLTISQGCRHWFVFYISRLLWSINYINTHNYKLFQNINTRGEHCQFFCEQDTIFPSLCPNYLEFLIRYKLLSAKDKLFYFTTWKINLNLGTRSSLTHWLHPLHLIMFAFLILSLMNKLAWSSNNWSSDFETDSQVLFQICPIPISTHVWVQMHITCSSPALMALDADSGTICAVDPTQCYRYWKDELLHQILD